ncbi:2-isopropylmalate synthase [Rhizomicrobium palustre]|uniref:Citramalate synthase n=1 Tax=Rhizomicrobium palustre TaxID=189966 RepID=A0A846MVW1_9PROT|nr:citramalate synthase [Rhizomicrobium palustre]NIK87212.1 2-isopropylmalate synthase [Rhizomicrobium palustre]
MSRDHLYLYDVTLRDGAQTQGVDFSVGDKREIALALDALGIDTIEGGWPGANPGDTEFFETRPVFGHARLAAFGMTKRAGRSISNDPGFGAVVNANADTVTLVGKSWDFQVEVALGIPLSENLESITGSIAAVKEKGREALFDAEHFFDGYKADPAYALSCLKAAADGGADWVVLCDTNGGSMPADVYRIVSEVKARFPEMRLGIHAHNDTEQAVAVSLEAVRAGVRQVQGTLNGLGERCGNANLCAILPTLILKEPFASLVETSISAEQLKTLTRASRMLDEILNRAPARHAAYVGPSAFAHKGGLHSSAMLKDTRTYEHVPPESVGNARKILVSDQAGKSNLLARLAAAGIDVDAKDPRLTKLLDDVKQREHLGYTFDGAEASFELLARRALGEVPEFFEVDSFRVIVEKRHNAMGELTTVSEATVRVRVDGETLYNVDVGHGPVDALSNALRKDLGKYSGLLADLSLTDYKVRILTAGTEAITRVMVESKDGKGTRFSTVGVSENIVDASFEALIDAIYLKLLRDGAKP